MLKEQSTKISIMDMDRNQFFNALAEKTTPELVMDNAHIIYTYMSRLFNENALDSLLREWAFQWSTEQLGVEYNVIYNKWLKGFTL